MPRREKPETESGGATRAHEGPVVRGAPKSRTPFVFAGGLFSALLFGIAMPPVDERLLAWFALVPLLVSLDRHRQSLGPRILHGLWFGAPVAAWYFAPAVATARSELPPGIAASLARPTLLSISLSFGALVLAWVTFAAAVGPLLRSPRRAVSILAPPTLWVAIEVARSEWLPRPVPQLAAGYLISPSSPEAAVATVGGVWGLGWLLIFVNTLFAQTIRPGRWQRQAAFATTAFAIVSVLALGGSAWKSDDRRGQTTVGIVQTGLRGTSESALELAAALADSRPVLIAFPSGVFVRDPDDPDSIPPQLRDFARRSESVIIAGLAGPRRVGDARGSDPPRHDPGTVAILSPAGELALTATSSTTLPGSSGNACKSAPHGALVSCEWGRIGVAAGVDALVPGPARNLAAGGADVLVVSSDEPLVWGPRVPRFHARMSAYRALETGRWLVRATRTGVSSVVAPSGAPVLEAPPGLEWASLETVAVPARRETIFVRAGWLWGPSCLVASAIGALAYLLAGLFGMRRK